MIAGLLLGAGIVAAAWALAASRAPSGTVVAGETIGCVVSIYLLEAADVVGRAVDLATGGDGFSHVVAGGCEVDAEGEPLVYDCRPGEGVTLVPLTRYRGRRAVVLELTGCDGAELAGGLRASLGRRYAVSGSLHCATLVCDALPRALRERVRSAGSCSPNALARAMGARPPGVEL